MIAEEWKPIAARIVRRWPHVDWAAHARNGVLDQMLADLDDMPAEHVSAAVDALARDGMRFPPLAGDVRQKVTALGLDAPEWGHVKAELLRRRPTVNAPQAAECPLGECDGSTFVLGDDNVAEPCACRAGRILNGRDRIHPLVTAFLDEVGLDEFRDVFDDRTAEAQVREKWLGFVRATTRDAAYHGLEAPEALRQLRRVNGQPRPLAGILEAIVEGGPRELEAGT